MTVDWTTLVGALELTHNRTAINVRLDRGRGHQIEVVEHEDGLELSGLVATGDELRAVGLSPTDLWSRNGSRRLTGYVITEDGSAWVTARVPLAGLSEDEFQLVLFEVAREADRLEYTVAGAVDRY